MPFRIKKFNEFLAESLNPIFESNSKADSYRSIALKVVEIFSLYGFFLAQKPDVMKAGAWEGMMKDLASTSDIEEKWDKIIDLSKELQRRIASLQKSFPEKSGEFGFKGLYDYGKETEALPRATEYLRSASNASLGTFTPDEKSKAMDILDRALLSVVPFAVTESLVLLEREKILPPTNLDLLRMADSIGAKLMTIYDELEVTKSAFPGSETEINSFISSEVLTAVDDLKEMIQNEIPKVGEKAAEGYMKKLITFDSEVNKISQKSREFRGKMNQMYRPNYASASFEKSAQDIIDAVKKSIRDQGNLNFGWRKMSDVIAGSTEKSQETMGDAQSQNKTRALEEIRKKQKKQTADLTKHLIKKYQ